jgi:hypothetical protein
MGVIYGEFLRVYDASLCHFASEIASPDLKRIMNSYRYRLTQAAAQNPVVLKWKDYRKFILERPQNATMSMDVLA